MGSFKTSTQDMKAMLQSMDSNGDGKVDYQEFITAAIAKDITLQKEHLEATFKIFDQDGD